MTRDFDEYLAECEVSKYPARRIAASIWQDLDGRRGMGLDGLDEEVQFEILDEWIARADAQLEESHRFGTPPEPVVNPSESWCDRYAAWYHQTEE